MSRVFFHTGPPRERTALVQFPHTTHALGAHHSSYTRSSSVSLFQRFKFSHPPSLRHHCKALNQLPINNTGVLGTSVGLDEPSGHDLGTSGMTTEQSLSRRSPEVPCRPSKNQKISHTHTQALTLYYTRRISGAQCRARAHTVIRSDSLALSHTATQDDTITYMHTLSPHRNYA